MDIFNSLTSGAKFNSKKNKETINLFKGKVENKNDIIDIFGSSSDKKTNSTKPQSNKKKQTNKDQEEDDNMFEREDEVNAFRNRLAIKVKGENIIDPVSSFSSMNINKEMKSIILKNIEASDWKEPTPIQMQAIPCLLDGRDVLASAPTGSGKTAAYSIPLLSNLVQSDNVGVRALVLSPTKELSDQIHREMMRLCEGKRFKICNLKKTLITQAIHNHKGTSLFQKYDILVATPMRLITLLRASAIDLSNVQYIVLDEADRLLELNSGHSNDDDDDDEEDIPSNKKKQMKKGNNSQEKTTKTQLETNEEEQKPIQHRVRSAFLTQIDEILSCCTQGIKIQRALFSATINSFIKELSDNFLNDPIDISIGKQNTGASTINQKLIFVGREDGKLLAIRQLVQTGLKPPVLCFVQSIERAKDLFQELIYDGINVDIMHANKSPSQREETIRRFRNGEIWVLICTDLMARGIDFKGIQMVINYDLPLTPVNYIHRIGRTGRGGHKGEAITFFTESDLPYLRPVANVVKLSGCEVPDWMLAIKPLSTKEKRRLKVAAPKRRNIAASRLPWVENPSEEPEQTNNSTKKRKAKSQDNEEEVDYENEREGNQEEHWDQELTSYEENNQELHFGDIYDAEDNDQVYFHEQEPQPTKEQAETKPKKKTKGSKKEGKMSKKSSWEETQNNEEQEIVFGDMLDAEDNDQIYYHDNKTNPNKKKHTKKQAVAVVEGQKRPRTLSEEDFGEGDIEQPLHYLGDNFDAEDYDQSFYHEDEQEYQLPPSQSATSLSPSMGQTDKKKKKRKKN